MIDAEELCVLAECTDPSSAAAAFSSLHSCLLDLPPSAPVLTKIWKVGHSKATGSEYWRVRCAALSICIAASPKCNNREELCQLCSVGLLDSHSGVRLEALNWFCSISPSESETRAVLTAILCSLQDEDPEIRNVAKNQLSGSSWANYLEQQCLQVKHLLIFFSNFFVRYLKQTLNQFVVVQRLTVNCITFHGGEYQSTLFWENYLAKIKNGLRKFYI